jgi:hypothetical protein
MSIFQSKAQMLNGFLTVTATHKGQRTTDIKIGSRNGLHTLFPVLLAPQQLNFAAAIRHR